MAVIEFFLAIFFFHEMINAENTIWELSNMIFLFMTLGSMIYSYQEKKTVKEDGENER